MSRRTCAQLGVILAATIALLVLLWVKGPEAPVIQDRGPGHAGLLRWGQSAPSFRLSSVDGDTLGLQDLPECKSLLVLVDPRCRFSQELTEEMAERLVTTELAGRAMVLSARGVTAATSSRVLSLRGSKVVIDPEGRAFEDYGVRQVPTAYIINSERRVVDAGVGISECRRLMDRIEATGLARRRMGCLDCGS